MNGPFCLVGVHRVQVPAENDRSALAAWDASNKRASSLSEGHDRGVDPVLGEQALDHTDNLVFITGWIDAADRHQLLQCGDSLTISGIIDD